MQRIMTMSNRNRPRVNSNKYNQNFDFSYGIGKSVKFAEKDTETEYTENDILIINDSQCIPANHIVEEIPNSQRLTEYQQVYNLQMSQKNNDKFSQKSLFDDCSEKCEKDAKDIGTMTDCIPSKNLHLESQCNELFGRIVACEISKYSGRARFDKMKEILEIFQKIDIT